MNHNLLLIPDESSTHLDALTIIKTDESPQYPYILYFKGQEEWFFENLEEARSYFCEYFDFRQDPSRFFFPGQDTSNNHHNTAKSLPIIAINLCAEARFHDYLTRLIQDHGPQPYQSVAPKAAHALNLSPHICHRYLHDLVIILQHFAYKDEIIYPPLKRQHPE